MSPSLVSMHRGHGIASVVFCFMAGCATRINFTDSIRREFENEPKGANSDTADRHTAQDLQYFVSDRIVLMRAAESRSDRVLGGRILVRRGPSIGPSSLRRPGAHCRVGWRWHSEVGERENRALQTRAT